jgi:tetratricopeptide (TPR) repeat protein
MLNIAVTEEEIEAAEKLRAQGEFATVLALTQDMLNRATDDETRMRLLFNVVNCSTRLGEDNLTDEAIGELDKLPDPKMSRFFIHLIQSIAYIDLERAKEALDLIDANLKSEYMEREDFQVWKYEQLAYKGRALAFLARCEESLAALAQAHKMYPGGKREADILVDQANCMMALERYEEAYITACQVQRLDSGELATLAMQYMAECRMWQGRVQESLELYRELLKRLPCRLVQEERIQTGIKNGMTYLEKLRPQGKPS